MSPKSPAPPQSLEAEESVLGALLLSGNAIDAVSEILVGSDFYRPSHGVIYDTILGIYRVGEPVDVLTLVDKLEKSGQLVHVGGQGRIHELARLVVATSNVGVYASIVKEMATLRRMIRAGQEIAQLGNERPGDIENLLDRAEQVVFDLCSGRVAAGAERLDGAISETFERVAQIQRVGKGLLGQPTGLEAFDKLIGGMEEGNLIVFAGRTSMGKTSLALTIAYNVACQGIPVAVYSLEMGKYEVVQRLLAIAGNVNLHSMRCGMLTPEEWTRLAAAAAKLQELPFYADYGAESTVTQIRGSLRRLKQKEPKLGLAVVDYIGLLTSDGPHQNRTQEVTAMTRGLKQTARDVGVPVIALSQLSRAHDQRTDHRPALSDLRDSGSIEQDADLVGFVYREHVYDEDADPGRAELIVAKNRNGPIDSVHVAWRAATASFGNLAYV